MNPVENRKPLTFVGKRRSARPDLAETLRGEPLLGNSAIPWIIRPSIEGVDLGSWASEHRAAINVQLQQHRALLFRGFTMRTVEDFQRVVAASSRERLEYKDRSTPRTQKGDKIYTSTVYPSEQSIKPHNEGTYWRRWPTKIYFACLRAATEGGETPLVDVRQVYKAIDSEIVARFARDQMMLVRNYNDGLGLTWQEVFQTSDPTEVERYCVENGIEFTWKDGGRLRTSQVRPAIRVHPETGEQLWFNHVAFFHYSAYEPAIRDQMIAAYGIDGLPYNTCYGDGSPIAPDVIAAITEAYRAHTVKFPWQPGDVLLLDNMTIAHAREPYIGERLVLTAMADALSDETVSTPLKPAAV